MTNISLRFQLRKEDRQVFFDTKTNLSDQDALKFVEVINKARSVDKNLVPVAKYTKDKDLLYLIDQGWSIYFIDFHITENDLRKFYEKRGIEGATLDELQKNFPYVPYQAFGPAQFQLMLNGELVNMRKGMQSGYFLKKFEEKRQKKLNKDDVIVKPSLPKGMTKAEGKKHRKNILQKAKKSDIHVGGFKDEFVANLNDDEKGYIDSLDAFKIKLMMSEIQKKN